VAPGILIIGGGVAGLHTANLLARRLGPSRASIRLIDADGMHAYQPALLGLALGRRRSTRLTCDVRSVLHDDVELIVDDAIRLDPVAGKLWLRRGEPLGYDHAIIATGARLDYGAVPGLAEGSYDFYSQVGAERLRERLRSFAGGDVLVGVAGMPYRCPPSPVEFILRLEEMLRRRGLRDSTRLHFLSPVNRILPIEEAADVVEPIMSRRGIVMHTFVNVEEVDPQRHSLRSLEGEDFEYDLAILVPPHSGAEVVIDSGLGDPGGWIPTDPATLHVKGYRHLFALGDATDLPISKAGSTAHFESKVVAEQVTAAIEGRDPDPETGTYRGRVICFMGLGRRVTTIIEFDQDHPPRVLRPSRMWEAARWAFERSYWSTLRTGIGFKFDRLLARR
jgi:sulfide:quinone oxidoreductase